jgi:predicted dehydrogenase
VDDLIHEGAIGDILEYRGRGKEDHRGGGEDLWVLGSHVMNLIRHFAGDARWCFARVLENGKPITPADVKPGNEGIGPLAGDAVNAVYGLDGGATAYFGSRRHAAGERFGLQIFGAKGAIEILTGSVPAVHILQDPAWSPGRSGQRWIPVSSAGIGRDEPLQEAGLDAGNVLACRDLIAAIEEDRQPECSVYEGRNTVEMIAAVYDSHRQGRPVAMPLENRKNPLEGWQ